MTQIKIDVRQVEALGPKLQQLADGRRLGISALEAVNAVTTEFKETAIKGEVEDINLTEAYVRSKTDLALGTDAGSPSASITTRGDLTILGNFPGTVWYRAPGAPRRAGPVKGRRSAGVYANIRNSDRVDEPQWFLMRLKNVGKFGAFVRDDRIAPKNKRDGRAGKRHIYGPSPYALFRFQVDTRRRELEADLERRVVANVLELVDEVLT